MTFHVNEKWVNLAVFSLFFVFFFHAIEDPDIWFHMTIGRSILEQGRIPLEEFYIFTRLGEPAQFHEWGFGLIYQLTYQLAGISGMIILNALIGATTTLLLYLIARQRGNSIAASIAAVAIGFWLLEFRFVERPETFLYLAIALTLYCIESYRRQNNAYYLVAIPLVGLVLSQVHPSVIMLILVVGAFLVEAIIRPKENWKQVYLLGLTIVATALLSLLNPYGLEQLILPIKFSLNAEFLREFTEFLPAMSTQYSYRFLAAAALGLFSISGVRRHFSLAEWIILIAFTYLAYEHVRDIALLGIALALPLATAFDALARPAWLRPIIAACLLVFVAVDSAQSHRLHLDIDTTLTPLSSAELIAQYSRSKNILNFYHLGNYLSWRLYGTHRVVIDGRNFRDNKSIQLHDSLLSAVPGWEQSLQRYDIDSVVTPAVLPYSGDFVPLAFELIKNARWVLLGREPAGLVFIRKNRIPMDVPILGVRELWQQAKDELTRNLMNHPGSESNLKNLSIVESFLREH